MVDATKQLAELLRATSGKSKEEYEQLTRLESLLKTYDQSLFPDKQRQLATTYLRLGGNIEEADCAGAHKYYQKGIGLLDELVKKYGLETDKRDLANAWSSHASLHSQCGDEGTAQRVLVGDLDHGLLERARPPEDRPHDGTQPVDRGQAPILLTSSRA